MTCLSCISSIRRPDGVLWCQLANIQAARRCRFFCYEPGTDEGEREP